MNINAAVLRRCADSIEPFNPHRRIGLALIHSHFDLLPDEVMVETVDHEARVCTMRPMKRDAISSDGELIPTIWQVGQDGAELIPVQYC